MRRVGIAVVAAVCAIGLGGCSGDAARPTDGRFGAVVRVTPEAPFRGSSVVATSGSRALVAWSDSKSSRETRVFVSERTGEGAWESPRQVVATPFLTSAPSSAGIGHDGTAAVSWVVRERGRMASQIAVRTDDAWAAPVSIPPVGRFGLGYLALATTGGGDTVVAWPAATGSNAPGVIVGAARARSGRWDRTILERSRSIGRTLSSPVVAAGPNEAIVVWGHFTAFRNRRQNGYLMWSRWRAGRGWSTPARATGDGPLPVNVGLAVGTNGRAVAAWIEPQGGGTAPKSVLRTVLWTREGARPGPSLATGIGGSTTPIVTAISPRGNVAIMVERRAKRAAPSRLSMMRIDPVGRAGKPVTIAEKPVPAPPEGSADLGLQWVSAARIDDDGRATVAWIDGPTRWDPEEIRTGRQTLLVRTFEADGTASQPTAIRELANIDGSLYGLKLASLDAGRLLATWQVGSLNGAGSWVEAAERP